MKFLTFRPSEILVLCHSDKNAQFIQHTVDVNADIMTDFPVILSASSFSGFVFDHCRPAESASYQWLNETQLANFLEQNQSELSLFKYDPRRRNGLTYLDLLDFFNRLQSLRITPDDYLEKVRALQPKSLGEENAAEISPSKKHRLEQESYSEYLASHAELCEAYRSFVLLKERHRVASVADRIPMAIDLLEKSTVRAHFLDRFRCIVVDQLEDWNRPEYTLLESLAFYPESLMTRCFTFFGDDDQAIMEWAGAPRDVFEKIALVFPDAETLVLTDNYRQNQGLIDMSRNLISRNSGRLEQRLGISKHMKSLVHYPHDSAFRHKYAPFNSSLSAWSFAYETDVEEYQNVAELIRALLSTESNSESTSDVGLPTVAVITRFRSEAIRVTKFLHTVGMPVQVPLADYREIRFLMNILEVLLEPNLSSAPLYDLLSSGAFSISGSALAKVMEIHQKTQNPLRVVVEEYLKCEDDSLATEAPKRRAKKLFKLLCVLESKLGTYTLRQLVWQILKETKILAAYKNPGSIVEEKQSENIANFISVIEDYEFKLKDTRPAYIWPIIKKQCLQYCAAKHGDQESAGKSVGPISVGTVWGCKSHEYDYVIFLHCSDDRYPGTLKYHELQELARQSADLLVTNKSHVEQMRRVFYTGMTRAKRGVIFTHHRVSAHHGRPLRQSRFIPEALGIPSTIQAFRTVEKGVEDDSEQNVAGWTGAECASKIFGGGNFAVSRKPDSDIIANLHQLQVFLRCPLQFYHQFVISLPYRTMQLSIFQEAVSNVYTAFISGEVDQNCLSSVNKLRKIFNDCWTRHSVDPTEDPHIYESGMYIIDTLYEAEGDVELVRVNEPWKLDINLENSSPVQFNGYFQRIYNDGSIRQFIKYSESSPPEQGQLLLLANLLCYSYYVSHDKVLPTSVTIEYISSRYQLRTLRHVPDQNSIPEVANAITRITQKLSKAVYEAASNPKNCKKCPYNTNCPKSAN